jgi:hypothetical protein
VRTQSVNVLGTIWYPKPGLIGGASVVAIVVLVTLCIVTTPRLIGSATWAAAIRRLAPVLLLAAYACTEGSLFFPLLWGRSFPAVADILAGFIYLACGFGFALHSVRVDQGWLRSVAVAMLVLHGGILLDEWETPRLCRGGSRSLTIPGICLGMPAWAYRKGPDLVSSGSPGAPARVSGHTAGFATGTDWSVRRGHRRGEHPAQGNAR